MLKFFIILFLSSENILGKDILFNLTASNSVSLSLEQNIPTCVASSKDAFE